MDHPFLVALRPVVKALGAKIIDNGEAAPTDIPLVWDGEHVAFMRLPQLTGALDRLIDQVEAELGGNLEDLSREAKQRAVKMLDDRGAFVMRRSVEEVADAFGVSRITIYNYLNASRDSK